LKRAFCSFSREMIDESEAKTRSILFGLCHFHSIMVERKKFGPMGFNMVYPFSLGDLQDSAVCLTNYMENAGSSIPWQDLRYIFGQIMYGGHIVNDFDRLLCMTYLEFFMKDELMDETELFPFVSDFKGKSFMSPSPCTYNKYIDHIDVALAGDTPLAYGLHPNAEIGFRMAQSDELFGTLIALQPREAGSGDGDESPQHIAENVTMDLLDRFRDVSFDIEGIKDMIDEMGPFQNVFLQECGQMNMLLEEIRRSLVELNAGFAGELTMSDVMEQLMLNLCNDEVPSTWATLAWPSMRPLGSWTLDLTARLEQLQTWVDTPNENPACTWISGLMNPQSFLTAIMQQSAQRNRQELDKLIVYTEVSKMTGPSDLERSSRDGAYVHGLSMEGATWNVKAGAIEASKPREMFTLMPVINCRAMSAEKTEKKGVYMCPVYKTRFRGPTYVFMAQLKTKSPPARWIMAGVALIMDVQ